MTKLPILVLTAVLAYVFASPVNAQTTASSPATKQVIALVAAGFNSFSYVRQKQQTGSNVIDNNVRVEVKVPGNSLNLAVLRGLERGVGGQNPNAEFVYVSLNAEEMKDVLPQDREAAAIGKIVAALEKMPDRAKWDKVIVATPKFLFSGREGMGPKLSGIGIYVQPLRSGEVDDIDFGLSAVDIDKYGESTTATPQGNQASSKQYVAPFAYMQVYTLDPRSLKVLGKNARHDYQKLSDPESTALDVEKSIPPDFLAARVGRLIERSAARGAGEAEDAVRIDIGNIKEVKPADAKK
jgi:hypothetical protein